jgi:predicted Fe-S protein YdhL (DUF1289 family)
MTTPDNIDSPCTQICTVSADGEYCIGCGRTLDEIGGWSRASPDERTAILRRIAAAGIRAPEAPR